MRPSDGKTAEWHLFEERARMSAAMADVRPDQVNMELSTRLRLGLFVIGAITVAGCGVTVQDTESLVSARFQRSEIVGLVAGFGTTFAALPDLIAMFKRRSSKGMNPRMATIMGVFQILWVYYGLLIASRPVVLWNVIAVVTNFFTVGAYLYYARRESTNG
jgi:uncharacterized protein with PQ loop repeat